MKRSDIMAATNEVAVPLSMKWVAVKHYEIDDDSAYKFSDRLARENMWTKEYTLRVIKEYKRFMFLAVHAGHPVTPSIDVDECWHLHLLYTRDYWYSFKYALGREIHHGPTKGGKEEDDKFTDWYQKTISSYVLMFGEQPPTDIWPPSSVRFKPSCPVRVDLVDHWVIPVGDFRMVWRIVKEYIKEKIKKLWK